MDLRTPNGARSLVERHLRMVRSIARSVNTELGGGIEEADLIGYGTQGLIEAAHRFDAAQGVPFPAYAHKRVRGAIMDGVRRMAYLPRVLHARLRAAERIDDYLACDGSAAAPDLEAEVRALLGALQAISTIHVLVQGAESIDEIPDDAPSPHDVVTRREIAPFVQQELMALTPRERRFLEMCYVEGRSIADAGSALGLSKSWASRLHKRIINRLRDRITARVE